MSHSDELKLERMQPLRIDDVGSTEQLLRQMAGTAFTGRALGEAVDVAEAMFRDETFVVLTLSGAMTMAGLSDLIVQMVDRGWIHCIVSTGALLGHGLVEDLGWPHYKARPEVSDEEYLARRLNRVYDTLEPEDNLDALEDRVRNLFDALAEERRQPLGTAELLAYLGESLPGKGVLQACARSSVPVFVPAFTDSELGLDFAVHQDARRSLGRPVLAYDGFRDLQQYRELCERQPAKLGIFTIGGGVPRNWAQQIGPYADIRAKRLGIKARRMRFAYGVRICPDPVHYGHLSGCTYSEGVSWGKFQSTSEGGRYAEVLLDATVGWPLLVRSLIERGL